MLFGHMINTNLNFSSKKERLSLFYREVNQIQQIKSHNKVIK